MHIIGNGAPSFIEGFRELTGYSGTIFTDPSLKTYAACGLLRSVRATVHPRAVLKGLRAHSRGQRQGTIKGDAWQQGGALVVNTGGDLLFRQKASDAGDAVEPQALLDALDAAKG